MAVKLEELGYGSRQALRLASKTPWRHLAYSRSIAWPGGLGRSSRLANGLSMRGVRSRGCRQKGLSGRGGLAARLGRWPGWFAMVVVVDVEVVVISGDVSVVWSRRRMAHASCPEMTAVSHDRGDGSDGNGDCDGDGDNARTPHYESTPEVLYSGAFATLTPDGSAASSAFNDLVVALLENPDSAAKPEPYHAQFLCLEFPSSPPAEPSSPSSSFSSSTTPYGAPTPRGCYRLSLDVLPEGPGGAWRIGKGSARAGDDSRGVDLLLLPPGQHKGTGVANVHALISIHALSGAFMLRSASSRPIIYLSAAEDGADLVLRQGDQAVLHKTVNRLRIGALDFILSFSVEQEHHFQAIRDTFITSILEQSVAPHPQLDVIPQPYHQKVARFIMHKSISAGAFGMVRSAVESTTGRPVAVKRLSCKGSRESSAVEVEARIASLFSSDDPRSGVIPLLSSWCEHNARFPCGRSPEDVFLAMPLAHTDFGHADWRSISEESRISLFHDTLVGLERIHAAGIMHRDISLKNLLIRSLDPPTAAICDFGKATKQPQSFNTAIGPIETVAPEVWTSTPRSPYRRTADIWSLGYAWLSTFGHLRGIVSADGSLKTDEARARGIRRELDTRILSGAIPLNLGNVHG
ncbi:kinase-like domain-containing protein [Cercophora newfieldiana]|uniref:EKC/KEOPS complex subunit BUD32 n=1 Tax=Cercophora newfieldiana TaxID=92897 RepID=A0AA40CST9_9PEZI|nr:kinase-like domain-containing protein [Cercophora newfieldiana]